MESTPKRVFSMKNKIWKIIYSVIFALQVIVEAVTLGAVLRLNMLPNKFLLPVIVLFVLGVLVTGLLLFIPARKKSGLGRRIVACLLAAVIMALCMFALTAVNKLHNTMQNITNTDDWETTGDTRQVFVRSEDSAQTLEDAANYTFGFVENYDTESTEGAIRDMEQKLGKSIATVSFPTIPEMLAGLYNGSCQAIILNEGVMAILEEEEGLEDVREHIRVLYDAQVLQEQPEQPQQPEEPETTGPSASVEVTDPTQPEEEFDVTTTPFIMYVSGLDGEGRKLYRTRSDVNILVVVNPNTKQVLMVNTPRDSFIPNPAGDGMYDKLAHCSAYGFDYSLTAMSELYDIELDYYARINFTGFKKLVDAVGGVDVYSEHTYHRAGVQIVKGMNHLDGEGALVFARERKYLPGGDKDRGKNQMKIIKAIIQKATSGTTIITNYPQILDSLGGMFVTSMSNEDLSALVKMQLDDMATWDIKTYAISGEGGWEYTYSSISLGKKSWVMYPDEGMIAYGSELIQRVLDGEVLTDEDVVYKEP